MTERSLARAKHARNSTRDKCKLSECLLGSLSLSQGVEQEWVPRQGEGEEVARDTQPASEKALPLERHFYTAFLS